ncbi:TetR/AcrR family transcriptional regulator [Microvirga sp. GCM10011540]|uniref:TetR/AcrR family transcriptional regulator n=1 Tax=Microvirga sp. GCM10011540 TaxID=3317338 RepID=UPI00361A93E0
MSAVDKRKLRGDRVRAGILYYATQIASRDGLEYLTFGHLAADAGIARSNIQVLFGDKEALQLATNEYGIAIYFREVVDPAMAKPTPWEQLVAQVEGWYAFVENRTLPGGCLIHALSNEYRTRVGTIRKRVDQHRADAHARFLDLLEQAKSAGQIHRDIDVHQVAFELTSH